MKYAPKATRRDGKGGTTTKMTKERWQTRYGRSVRLVTRDAQGRFVDNVSAKQLRKVGIKGIR